MSLPKMVCDSSFSITNRKGNIMMKSAKACALSLRLNASRDALDSLDQSILQDFVYENWVGFSERERELMSLFHFSPLLSITEIASLMSISRGRVAKIGAKIERKFLGIHSKYKKALISCIH